MEIEAEKQKTAYHHGDLRRALIDATRQLVQEKGPDHFSVAEAARVAGVSKAAPYKHFADRDEMLMAVVMDAMDQKYEGMKQAIAPLPPESPERIMVLGQLYVRFAQAEPNLFRLMFGLSEEHGNDAPAVEKGQRTFGIVQETVAGVLGLDEVTPEAAKRAFMLWSFVHGLSFLLIDGKVSSMGLDIDVDAMLGEIGRRVMAPLT